MRAVVNHLTQHAWHADAAALCCGIYYRRERSISSMRYLSEQYEGSCIMAHYCSRTCICRGPAVWLMHERALRATFVHASDYEGASYACHAAQFERAGEELNLDGQCRMHLQSEAAAGNITVGLAFNYMLSSGLSGFYRTEYIDGNGVPRVVAATQFESMSARKAFPCFDEPALKVLCRLVTTCDVGTGPTHPTHWTYELIYLAALHRNVVLEI
jgi:hypothetical protein